MEDDTSGFVGGLTEESGELSLALLQGAGGPEGGKTGGGGEEGLVSVEAFCRRTAVVAVREHFLKQLLRYDAADIIRGSDPLLHGYPVVSARCFLCASQRPTPGVSSRRTISTVSSHVVWCEKFLSKTEI